MKGIENIYIPLSVFETGGGISNYVLSQCNRTIIKMLVAFLHFILNRVQVRNSFVHARTALQPETLEIRTLSLSLFSDQGDQMSL
jgi:hypothetical protein